MPSHENNHELRNETQSAFSLAEEDYLTPEQRLNIVADILSDIALRIVKQEQALKQSHEHQNL